MKELDPRTGKLFKPKLTIGTSLIASSLILFLILFLIMIYITFFGYKEPEIVEEVSIISDPILYSCPPQAPVEVIFNAPEGKEIDYSKISDMISSKMKTRSCPTIKQRTCPSVPTTVDKKCPTPKIVTIKTGKKKDNSFSYCRRNDAPYLIIEHYGKVKDLCELQFEEPIGYSTRQHNGKMIELCVANRIEIACAPQ